MASFGSELLAAVCGDADPAAAASLRHVTEMPARRAESRDWPSWAEPICSTPCATRASPPRGPIRSRPPNSPTPVATW